MKKKKPPATMLKKSKPKTSTTLWSQGDPNDLTGFPYPIGHAALPYQKEPFRIVLKGYGVFKAYAAEGVIRPVTKKAKCADARVKKIVKAHATAYLKRTDWKWEL